MTMRHLNTYKTFDIVSVPFPFTTDARAKNRPALVLSSHEIFNNFVDHCILAMITSATHTQWPHDIEIEDPASCGLTKPCLVRFKLFTLDNRLIHGTIGKLSLADQQKVRRHVSTILKDILEEAC